MSNIDTLLEKLSPQSRKPSKTDLSEFIRESLKQISKINDQYKKYFESTEGKESAISNIEACLKTIKEKYSELFEKSDTGIPKVIELDKKIEEIKNYHKELLEGGDSIKEDIKESQSKIIDFYVYLFGSEGVEGQETKIKTAINIITDFHDKLIKEDGLANAIDDAHSKIIEIFNSFYAESEGVPSKISNLREDITSIEVFEQRIKEEITPLLDKKQKTLSDIESDIVTKQGEIEALLSNATIRTLAEGYSESMQMYGSLKSKSLMQRGLNFLTTTFNYLLFILPLLLIGLIFTQPQILKEVFGLDQLDHINFSGTEYMFYKISVSIPMLWISWYGQKNISYRRRLFEEYNHKLRVVQMYLMFSTNEQSYKLDKKSHAALQTILLDAIHRNPSEVYGRDETMLDKIIEILKINKGVVEDAVDPVKKAVTEIAKL